MDQIVLRVLGWGGWGDRPYVIRHLEPVLGVQRVVWVFYSGSGLPSCC